MSLEALTGDKYLDSLVATNPVGETDPKSQGDDHIRGIKNVLLKTFAAVAGPVTATHADLSLLAGIAAAGRKVDNFPAGTKMVFFQAAAPTGWTQDATNTDAALRVVSTVGGGTGGSASFSTLAHTHTGPSHTHTTAAMSLTVEQMPAHTHNMAADNSTSYGGGSYVKGNNNNLATITTGSSGSGAVHGHGDTGASGTAATGSTSITPKYIDVIVCAKN